VAQTFPDLRIVNGHSVMTSPAGQMKFIISHRFGSIDGGIEEFFGLDEATIRLGLDYGITDRLTVGVGRSSFEKTFDGYAKYAILRQTKDGKMPISLTGLATVAIRSVDLPGEEELNELSAKTFYSYQLLVAKKLTDRLSVQIMPTLVHRNLVLDEDYQNDVFSAGGAARYQVSRTVSLQTEYYYVLPDQISDQFNNSLSFGCDIETKNHVFQLHVSNSQGMIEKFFIGETRGSWEDGEVYFGFNISRDFQLSGRKYK